MCVKIDCENEGKRKLNIYFAPQSQFHITHSFPKKKKSFTFFHCSRNADQQEHVWSRIRIKIFPFYIPFAVQLQMQAYKLVFLSVISADPGREEDLHGRLITNLRKESFAMHEKLFPRFGKPIDKRGTLGCLHKLCHSFDVTIVFMLSSH